MKYIQALCLFLFLVSCNEEKKTPAAAKNIPGDTNIIKSAPINPFGTIDVSPMDVSYFPVDYPLTKMTAPSPPAPVMRVFYSRPHKQGRKIFGNLLKYGEAWRLGANEATEIEFFQPVSIQNKTIPRGRYIMYCIPEEKSWTVVFNNNIYSWGLKQDPKKDVHKFDIPVEKTPASIEHFTMVFQKAAKGANLIIAWDDVMARLPIVF